MDIRSRGGQHPPTSRPRPPTRTHPDRQATRNLLISSMHKPIESEWPRSGRLLGTPEVDHVHATLQHILTQTSAAGR
jgi:hypothetical protein